jgi:hypothetical protein
MIRIIANNTSFFCMRVSQASPLRILIQTEKEGRVPLLSFRFLCFYLPDANSEALFLSFALHKSACLHRTAIQNP